MTNVEAPELVSLGYTAEVIYHRSETAVQASRKAASSGHADQAPKAAFNLGELLANQADSDGMTMAVRQGRDWRLRDRRSC
jgi:hypothetical protein